MGLNCADVKFWVAFNSQPHHFDPVRYRRHGFRLLKSGLSRWNEQHPFQLYLVHGGFGDAQVPQVDGVEGPTQNPYVHVNRAVRTTRVLL